MKIRFDIFYLVSNDDDSQSDEDAFSTLTLMAIYLCSLILPIMMNWKRIKGCDIVMGTIYNIFLAPTYVNIITIFAIANIHDITWGSRPSSTERRREEQFEKIEREKDLQYRNFRSKFLTIWVLINTLSALIANNSARGNSSDFISAIVYFLTLIVGIKLFFCLLFFVSS